MTERGELSPCVKDVLRNDSMDVIRVRRWDRWQRWYSSIGPRLLEYLRARLPIPDKPLGRRALEIHAGRAWARCAHERVELRALLRESRLARHRVGSADRVDAEPGRPRPRDKE